MSRYTLVKACKIVRKLDGSSGRLQVFDDVVRKNWLIRTALFCYASAPAFIKSYLLILYGLKCYLSARSSGSAEADILFFAVTPG